MGLLSQEHISWKLFVFTLRAPLKMRNYLFIPAGIKQIPFSLLFNDLNLAVFNHPVRFKQIEINTTLNIRKIDC